MKKVLMLTGKIKEEQHDFVRRFAEKGLILEHKTYSELLFKIDEKLEVFIDHKTLNSYDAIFIRGLLPNQEIQYLIAQYCKSNNILLFDRVFRQQGFVLRSKIVDYAKMAEQSIPIIPTYFTTKNTLEDIHFSFPWIIKLSNSARGEGVFLADNKEKLASILENIDTPWFMVEPFVENSGDVRVLILNNKIVGSIKRKAADDDFRNNVSQGGTSELFDISESLSSLSLEAANSLDYDFAGVDLIHDVNKKTWFVMEVNCCPQFSGLERTLNISVVDSITDVLNEFLLT